MEERKVLKRGHVAVRSDGQISKLSGKLSHGE